MSSKRDLSQLPLGVATSITVFRLRVRWVTVVQRDNNDLRCTPYDGP